jgi:hypothetical protein
LLRLLLGRGFDAKDEKPGNEQVAVISHALWQTMLGGGRPRTAMLSRA